MSKLDEVDAPYWNDKVDLPSFLEDLAAQMRRGDYTISVEAVLLTKDMSSEIITICRWGEPTGLCSEATLKEIVENSRTTT